MLAEFLKIIHRFIFRDLSFVLGGASVIASYLYVYGRLDSLSAASAPVLILTIGLSYAVGYVVQDWATIVRIVRTKAEPHPNPTAKWLYDRFERTEWEPFEPDEYRRAKAWLFASAPQRMRDDHERIESLKQVGTAVGTSLLVSAAILVVGVLSEALKPPRISFEVGTAIVLFLVGLGLNLLGWLKVTQQPKYLIAAHKSAAKADSTSEPSPVIDEAQ